MKSENSSEKVKSARFSDETFEKSDGYVSIDDDSNSEESKKNQNQVEESKEIE